MIARRFNSLRRTGMTSAGIRRSRTACQACTRSSSSSVTSSETTTSRSQSLVGRAPPLARLPNSHICSGRIASMIRASSGAETASGDDARMTDSGRLPCGPLPVENPGDLVRRAAGAAITASPPAPDRGGWMPGPRQRAIDKRRSGLDPFLELDSAGLEQPHWHNRRATGPRPRRCPRAPCAAGRRCRARRDRSGPMPDRPRPAPASPP
jgi:hypothetical protein